MNLPFSPNFFRKIDIFQQLLEYEAQKSQKPLWNGVKATLVWAASEEHRHLGSSIGTHHIKNALTRCVNKGFITQEEQEGLSQKATHILESLTPYGFGDTEVTSSVIEVKINRNGLLAGEILTETDFLRRGVWKYYIWTCVWWLVLIAGGILLLSQTFTAVQTFFPNSHHKEKHHRNYHQEFSKEHYRYESNFR